MENTGDKFGCWRILNRAEDKIESQASGRVSKRAYMNIICENCNSIFEVSTRNLRRRTKAPYDCPNCKNRAKSFFNKNPDNKKGYSKTITHVDDGDGFPICGSRSFYGHVFSDDPTCKTCIKMTIDK